ncbi:MAG TPA: NAD-dependent epimerase/dehydratase family protein [Stellaceae bacterium]|nr:NAD-dependent epimerase/dehydratase family protein [Stellaceae bacterium]
MARYLITGGCGFIGSHLADALVARGHRVRILDNLSTGKRENAPTQAELVIGDVTEAAAIATAAGGMDGIFHLAAIASVEESRRNWLHCHAVNMTGTINVFEAARRGFARPRVVYASSAAVYGDCPAVPLTEADTPRPINAYGADKLGCELHGRVATLLHDVPTVGLRLFNIYGERQDPSSPYTGVISIFADRLARRLPIDIHGDGRQVRDFVAVSDAVEALLLAMSAEDAAGEAFNVCSGYGTTVHELASIMGEICGAAPELRYGPARPGDIRISLGDPTRAARTLGFRTRLAIRQGLALSFGKAPQRIS